MIKGFKILANEDIRSQLEHIHEHGWASGVYVGFPMMEKHYNILAGGATDWTGYPQSGKTELLLEFLLFTAENYGHVHLLQMPDIGKSIDIMIKLIHKYTGQTFKRQYSNFISLEKIWEACPFLLHHFRILHPVSRGATPTPVQLWEYAAQYRLELAKDGINLASCVIDSWKDMKHDYAAHGGGYATYLSAVLPQRNAIAEQSGLHLHTIVHPKNPVRDKKRKIYPPWPDDMEGGAQWNSSGKAILAIHREDWDSPLADIYFRKIKPEQVGRSTSTPVVLHFDVIKSRYYWLRNIPGKEAERVYAEKKDSAMYKEWMGTYGSAEEKRNVGAPDAVIELFGTTNNTNNPTTGDDLPF